MKKTKKTIVALLASGALFMAAGSVYAGPGRPGPIAHLHTRVHESIRVHFGFGQRWRPGPGWRWRRAHWRRHHRCWCR